MLRGFTLRQHLEMRLRHAIDSTRFGRWLKCRIVGHDDVIYDNRIGKAPQFHNERDGFVHQVTHWCLRCNRRKSTPIERIVRVPTREKMRTAFDLWGKNSRHATFLERMSTFDLEDPNLDDYIRHEAFAFFRAGVRFGATGNPFRQETHRP